MEPPVYLLPSGLGELFAKVNTTGEITLADRYGLMAAILDESLSQEEQFSINRVLRSVCRGKIKVVNKISSVGSNY